MIEYIKRYFFARAVCKKRGIKFIPRLNSRNLGSYRYYTSPLTKIPEGLDIEVSLFSDKFYEIFAHEVGHLIDHSVRDYAYTLSRCSQVSSAGPYLKYENGKITCVVLSQELRASRCARLLLRSWGKLEEGSMEYLNQAYGTYLRGYPKHLTASISYHGMKYLQAKY